MTPRQGIGELEISLLLVVLRLDEEAHGPGIRKELAERTGRRIGPGTLYPTLERLEDKGLLESRLGAPTPKRGGRAKRFFTMTPRGLEEAQAAWRRMSRMAEGFEGVLEAGTG